MDQLEKGMTGKFDVLLRIRRPFIVLLHVLLIVLSNRIAFWLRFDGDIPDTYDALALTLLPWLVLIRLTIFTPFRLFEGLWKYTSLWDLRNIVLGVTLSTVVFYPLAVLGKGVVVYPRSIHIIDAVVLICLMSGIRLTRRLYSETIRPQGGRRVLIYGAGDAGELIVRDMRLNARFHATPVGFIDDDYRKAGQTIHGVPVLGGRAKIKEILARHSPEELLIAIPSASRETLRDIVRALEPHKIRITTLPRLHDLIGNNVEVGQIRQLEVEDLLARDPIGLDYTRVHEFLKARRVIVTGAGGSIGSELCRQIAAAGPSTLVLLDRYENGLFQIHRECASRFPESDIRPVVADVTDERKVDQLFAAIRPEIVFHAAAHKHVPLMEGNPCEAVKNNVRGTRIVAEAAVRHKASRFLLISTDKAVNPTSVMGATKRIAELIVSRADATAVTQFSSVRFGNVLASNGSVVPTFLAQIAKGGPVTVTHPEMRRFFMLIPEAVQLVLHAATIDDVASLFVLEMGEQIRVVDMARDIIRLSGYIPETDIAIEFTGMRPGEKLFEELVSSDELAEASSVEKIQRVTPARAPDPSLLMSSVMRLEMLAAEGKDEEVISELRVLVPTFSSAHAMHSTV